MITLLHITKILLIKELKEVVRDRRSLVSAILLSLLMPVFMLAGYYFAAQEAQKAKSAEIIIHGQDHAPDLVAFLSARGFNAGSEAQLTLSIPIDYPQKLASGYRAELILSGDMSGHGAVASRLLSLIQLYASQLASNRLLAQGLSPVLMNPIAVHQQDSGEAPSLTRFLAPLFVFMLLMTPIYSVMPACIDCIAGERERHGLYPLLLQPISPWTIPLAKWLMLLIVGSCGLLLAISSGFVAYANIELNGLSLGFNLTARSALIFVLVSLPTIGLLAAMMMGIASYAKTFKEGQTYVGLATIFPVFVAGLGSLADKEWQPFLPLWAEATLLGNVLAGTQTMVLPWLLVATGYGFLIAFFLWWMSRSMQRQALSAV